MKKRILIIDDADDVRDFYRHVLEDAGYQVVTTASGEEGFEKIKSLRPDLILLDVVMPGMDGLELLLKMRSDLSPPIPPAILCSGFDITKEEALRRGALMFLPKPVDPSELLVHVARGIDGRPANPLDAALAERHANTQRRRAHAVAADLMRQIEARQPPIMEALRKLAADQMRWLAGYFALGGAATLLLRGENLSVLASAGHAPFTAGAELNGKIPQTDEVLETGSSLVIADASRHPCFSSVCDALAGVRFFAGAPLVAADNVPIGVISVFDPQPHRFSAEDLCSLEQFGRRGSLLLNRLGSGEPLDAIPGSLGAGVLHRRAFESLIEREVRLFQRMGGSIELLIVDTIDTDAVRDALAAAPQRERLVAGALSASQVVIFKRDRGDGAQRQLAGVLRDLTQRAEVRAVGATSLRGTDLPALSGSDLVRLAQLALERASENVGSMRRLVIQYQTSAIDAPVT